MRGFGVTRAGRNTLSAGMAAKSHRKILPALWPASSLVGFGRAMVGDTDDDVFAVFIGAWMILEGEFRAANDSWTIGTTQNYVVLGLQLLDAQFGIVVSVVPGFLISKVSREIVDFETGIGMLLFLSVAAERLVLGRLKSKSLTL